MAYGVRARVREAAEGSAAVVGVPAVVEVAAVRFALDADDGFGDEFGEFLVLFRGHLWFG